MVGEWQHAGKKRTSFAPFYSTDASFYQDRLGTNIGKALKKERCGFLTGSLYRFVQGSPWDNGPQTEKGKKTKMACVVCPLFECKNDDFDQDRLGTNRGETQKKMHRLCNRAAPGASFHRPGSGHRGS